MVEGKKTKEEGDKRIFSGYKYSVISVIDRKVLIKEKRRYLYTFPSFCSPLALLLSLLHGCYYYVFDELKF